MIQCTFYKTACQVGIPPHVISICHVIVLKLSKWFDIYVIKGNTGAANQNVSYVIWGSKYVWVIVEG